MLWQAMLLRVVIGIPVVSGLVALLSAAQISERHHIHHDTYSISKVVANTLVLVMVFMGLLGALVGWLCHLGVYAADPVVPLGFFAAFQLSMLLAFAGICRCQVMAYDDYMFVRPWLGRRREVAYADITRMRRTFSLLSPLFRDLRIYTVDGGSVRVSGLLDIEHMLVRIDRYDVLEG